MATYQRRSRDEWQSLVTHFESSGLSAKQFCEQQSLSQSSFYQWRQRLTQSTLEQPVRDMPFIDVSSLASLSEPADKLWQVELDLGHGITLRLNHL